MRRNLVFEQLEAESQLPPTVVPTFAPLQSIHSSTAAHHNEDDNPATSYRNLAREKANLQLAQKRRLKRRRKARGSPCFQYCAVRLQLRSLCLLKPLFIFIFGALALLTIWIFLVFGKPPNTSTSHWPTITENVNTSSWGGLLLDNTLCEEVQLYAFTKQPGNGFATVCYALVGWFMLVMHGLDFARSSTFESRFGNLPASIVIRHFTWSALLGVSMWFLALASYLRHATQSKTGRRLEVSGYWCVLFALTLCCVNRLLDPPKKLRVREWTIVSGTTNFVCLFACVAIDVWFGIRLELLQAPMIPEIAFGVLAGLGLFARVLFFLLNRHTLESEVWWIIWGGLSFSCGYVLARFDLQACLSPQLFIQPYGLWHFFCSLAVLCFYFNLRSDLWKQGDGADLAPRIRPLHTCKRIVLQTYGFFLSLCQTEDDTLKKKPANNVKVEDLEEKEDNAGVETTTTDDAQPKNKQRWTSDMEFTSVQLRFAQAICGLGITGAVIYVIYLALGEQK